jgi:hypothetical protein
MKRGNPMFLVIKKQTDQADPLDGAAVLKTFNTLDELQRGIISFGDILDKVLVIEAFPLSARVETKVILGDVAPAANVA